MHWYSNWKCRKFLMFQFNIYGPSFWDSKTLPISSIIWTNYLLLYVCHNNILAWSTVLISNVFRVHKYLWSRVVLALKVVLSLKIDIKGELKKFNHFRCIYFIQFDHLFFYLNLLLFQNYIRLIYFFIVSNEKIVKSFVTNKKLPWYMDGTDNSNFE